MTTPKSTVRTLYFESQALMLLDQRRLPHAVEYVRCGTSREVVDAIVTMVVRGAPAIGIAAAYGVVLAVADAFERAGPRWREVAAPEIEALRSARPTAVNLGWAIDAMVDVFAEAPDDPRELLLRRATILQERDVADNVAMGAHGAAYITRGSRVLTHCNAGALATAGYGTALGVIRSAYADERVTEVYATETRPWLQGARLTTWELHQDGIPVTLIADSAAAALMRGGDISWVITGADRVAANGDVANKIGTYSLALCARAHGVRFMVAAPCSTIDPDTPDGAGIPIEQRATDELLGFRSERTAPPGVAAYNPVFDVTPAALIDVLVTEKGAIEQPGRDTIAALLKA
ncbi:MAG: S-methyl-5-thioribose-1-phosphate isomerase [Gammaproteobacteria bacterium]|jgi:methylthioribose-1-phosphate isomerase